MKWLSCLSFILGIAATFAILLIVWFVSMIWLTWPN
jgi:hypothetical protein